VFIIARRRPVLWRLEWPEATVATSRDAVWIRELASRRDGPDVAPRGGHMLLKNLSALLFAIPLAACAAPVVEDDLAGELADEGEAGKADDHGTFTFFTIERDTRRCVSPLCGGYWVSRIQRDKTICADGSRGDACYVAELDASVLGGVDLLGSIEQGRVIVKGEIEDAVFDDHGNLGRFVLEEAWTAGAAAGAPDPEAVWVKVEQTGVRCAAAPCADKAEYKLNSVRTAMIADLDFEPSGATEAEIEQAWTALAGEAGGAGLIVVGDRYYSQVDGRRAKSRTVTQFYTRIEAPAPAADCVVTGCSGQVCADEEVFTTCEWRDEYACYAEATCERQVDGACGWTMTEELESCLGDVGQN
jgi:eight-cysteine-cluster-containing protein